VSRGAKAHSIVRRRFHRSTNTPATGPTTRAGRAAALTTPPTATGAQVSPFAICTVIHRMTVLLKTYSPIAETA
jgi:hypothetical protein